MLAIHDPRTAVGAAGLQQFRIPAVADHERLEARHRRHPQRPARKRAQRHEHFMIDDAELVVASKTGLRIVLPEHRTLRHEHPSARGPVDRPHRRRIRQPRRSRAEPREWNVERQRRRRDVRHVRHVVLRDRAAHRHHTENHSEQK